MNSGSALKMVAVSRCGLFVLFVGPAITRIDFIQHFCLFWKFPEGYSDIVELSKTDFRKNAHLNEPQARTVHSGWRSAGIVSQTGVQAGHTSLLNDQGLDEIACR